MIHVKKINESFMHITGEVDSLMNISDYFSFYTPNYRWSPKYKAGIWDGKLRLFNRKTGLLGIGLYPRLKFFCKQSNIDAEYDFQKTSIKITEKNVLDYCSKKLKLKHIPRDYQIKAVIDTFAQQKLVVKSPTASGKSLILFIITQMFEDLYSKDSLKKILVIVPTIGLVGQMKGDFIEYAEDYKPKIANDILEIYSGQERDWSKKIIVSTWQSLQNITDMRIFQKFGCVLVDEVFSAETAIQIQQIIQNCSNAKIKLGVAGTLNDDKINKIQLEALFGKVNQETSTKKLMDNGTLSKLKIKVFILNYNKDLRRTLHKIDYHDEMKALQQITARSEFIINCACQIKNKNVLILFKNIKYGELLYQKLLNKNTGRKIYYVAGSTDAERRKKVKELTIADNDAIIVASLGVFAIGINIPNLDYVIFGQNFKSKIKVLQSIGRILRKTANKNTATLIDIVDNLKWRRRKNYALRHALERLEIYQKEKFNFSIKEAEIKFTQWE